MSVSLLLEMAASSNPDRTALVSGDLRLTTQQLSDLADGGAGVIAGSNAKHVAYVGTGGAMLPVLIFAAARAGLAFTPINYRLSADGVRALIERLPEPLVVVDDRYRDMIGDASDRVMSSGEFLTAGRKGEGAAEVLAFPDPESVAIVLFTSGTTSQPKAVELSHNNLTSYVTGTVEFESAEPTDAALICVPPYHIAGVGAALSNLYAGRKMVYLTNFDADEWVRLINAERVTTATVVPTMLDRIVTMLESGGHELPSLRNLAYGGSRVGLPLVRRALELLPHVGFVNAYGLTETSSTIAVLTPDDHRAAQGRRTPTPPSGWDRSDGRCPASNCRSATRTARCSGPAKPVSCSCAASRCRGGIPGSARCSTRTAGSRPGTSPCSTTRATCSSADAATTRSFAAVRTSRPPSWRRCSSSTPRCAMSPWSASTIRSGGRRLSPWWCPPRASIPTPRNFGNMSARACAGHALPTR